MDGEESVSCFARSAHLSDSTPHFPLSTPHPTPAATVGILWSCCPHIRCASRPTLTPIASAHTYQPPRPPPPPCTPPFRRVPWCSSPNPIPNPGQHRWVEYADIHNYDSSTVTAAWHPWLHHMSDFTPSPAAMVSLISVLFWFCFCVSVLCFPPPRPFFSSFLPFGLSFFLSFLPSFFRSSPPPLFYIFSLHFPSYFFPALYLACLGSQGFLSKSMVQRPDECEIQQACIVCSGKVVDSQLQQPHKILQELSNLHYCREEYCCCFWCIRSEKQKKKRPVAEIDGA